MTVLVLSGVTCKYLSLAYWTKKTQHLFKKKVKKVTSNAPLLLFFSAKPTPHIAGNSPKKVSLSNSVLSFAPKQLFQPPVLTLPCSSYRLRNSQTILFAADGATGERTCTLPGYLIFSSKISTSILVLDHHNQQLLRTNQEILWPLPLAWHVSH